MLFFLQTTSRCSSLRTWTRSYPTSFQGTRSLSSDILHSFTHAHLQHFLVRDQVFQLLGVRCLRQSEILMAYINRSIIFLLLPLRLGAEAAGKLPNGEDLSIASSLTIHLVGSRVAEMRHLTGWEIIAHRYPVSDMCLKRVSWRLRSALVCPFNIM